MEEKKSIFKQIVEQEELDALKEKDIDAFSEQIEINELSKSITLPQVKEICKKYLYLPDDNIIDFVLAVYVSQYSPGERLWSFIIGPPAVGKTEILRALVSEDTFLKDSLTARTLFSGLRVGGKDPSLFKRIHNKIFIVKDFTLSLSLRPEDLKIILAQLRCAYDGFFDASTGASDKDDHYPTNFSMLTGVTPAIDDHWSVRQMLGERFLSWRIQNIDELKLQEKVNENQGREEEMRKDLRLYLGALIKKYQGIEKDLLKDSELLAKTGTLANAATHSRSHVSRDRYTREIRRVPEREGMSRLFKQLLRLGQSLALIRGKTTVTEEEYSLLYKVAMNSIPPERIQVIETLIKLTKEVKTKDFLDSRPYVDTVEIADQVDLPPITVRRTLEDLTALKILDRKGGNPVLWSIDPSFLASWGALRPK